MSRPENDKNHLLKIQPKHVRRSGYSIVVPEIRLCGKWLDEIGFRSEKKILVICEEKKITLIPLDDEIDT